ncbi:MAG TPA: hypothetical protein VK152_08965 [Paludibacter sp.]|nr:hypothetical protein [Paludibacter sp.]
MIYLLLQPFAIMKLTEEDIRIIKEEKRMGIVFSTCILSLGLLVDVVYLVVNRPANWTFLISLNLGFIVLSLLCLFLTNRKLNNDLKSGIKITRLEKIQKKEDYTDYVGDLVPIPVLGNLFPRLWKQELRPVLRMNLVINGHRYEVDKEIFDRVKKEDFVIMYFTIHSYTFLGVEIVSKPVTSDSLSIHP